MNNRRTLILAMIGLGAVAAGQQTPPIQPKTVETPKLTPIQTPPLPPTQGQIVANAPLTASEAVQIALAHQPMVAIAKASADALHGVTIQTAAPLYPQLVASGEGIHSQTFQSANNVISNLQSQIEGDLTLNQLIFDFNRTRDQVRQAQANERAGYKSFGQRQQDVALQAKQDFYAYVQAQAQSKVQEANVKSRQGQVDLTQATVNAGTGEPGDLVNAKTLAAQGILVWSQALSAELTARVKLATDLGIDPRTPIKVADSSEADVTLPSDLNNLVDQALKQRPSVLSAIETLKAAGYGVSVARKTDAPSLNFEAGYDVSGPNNPFANQTGFVALTFTWTLLDGGLQHGKVVEAQANKASAIAQLQQASQNAIQDVNNALIAVQAARQQIPVANAEVADAEEGVRIALGSYRAGVALFQTVITAQAALVQAQTDQVNAIAASNNALAALQHAIGKWPL